MEALKFDGVWWVPGKEDDKVAGTMEFQPGGKCTLSLIGGFSDLKTIFSLDNLRFDVINGLTVEGQKITLYDCLRTSGRLPFPGVISEAYHVSILLVGYHFQSKEDVTFDTIRVSFTNLDDWVGFSGLQYHQSKDGNKNSPVVSYEYPNAIEADVNGVRISLDFGYKINVNVLKGISITEQKMFTIKLRFFKQIEEILREGLLQNLQNFISFGLGKSTKILTLTGANSSVMTDDNRELEISIIFSQRSMASESERIHPSTMLFRFGDIKDSFQEKISAWLLKAEQLQPIYNLYFSVMHQPTIYIDFMFLSLMQAIETYHRRTHAGRFLSNEMFSDVLNTIMSAIPKGLPDDYVKNLHDKLKYSNEFSLRRRIKELLRELGDITVPYIPDIKVFVQQVVDTRNYLTHYSVELEERALRGTELYGACLRLTVILQACLLKEMNFTHSEVEALLKRHYRTNLWFSDSIKKLH
ncbi:HEPN domain-containing protein [Alicyclobacillus macrosporangiidus]|uniref:Uncharacterized protein n=1 Tax=Alicyclobacillus macrosporangiidus TaxID=392015 RepID=A0A1I7LI60_9BACL|nr:HEPN domain-containing protein [Alicyclobacillus macrosporangiidus]SFV09373.1 hypothetical protein SAMN05421543_1572 [Alicyclobacillus macrosporangiidus]